MLRLFLALLAGLISPFAMAQDSAALVGLCFARSYDSQHLAEHPNQTVTSIRVAFQDFEDSLNASVAYHVRGNGPRRVFHAECSQATRGALSCTRCEGASCDPSGETFKILLRDKNTAEIVNLTGITVTIDDGGDPPPIEKLPADKEHRSFLLKRRDPQACGAD